MDRLVNKQRVAELRHRHRYLPHWVALIGLFEFAWIVLLNKPF